MRSILAELLVRGHAREEAERLEEQRQDETADRKREERQQDASIKRMNQQLQALLKEGRQALSTKVEVEMLFGA